MEQSFKKAKRIKGYTIHNESELYELVENDVISPDRYYELMEELRENGVVDAKTYYEDMEYERRKNAELERQIRHQKQKIKELEELIAKYQKGKM